MRVGPGCGNYINCVFLREFAGEQTFPQIRNLQNSEDRKEKRKTFLRSLIKSVDTGANGTLDYIVKKGSGKDKIAKTRQ